MNREKAEKAASWPVIIPPDSYTPEQLECFNRGLAIRDYLFDLFDQEVALVAIRPKLKAPVLPSHQKMTIEAVREPDCILTLGDEGRGTAVLLGSASNGLCSLDFDDPAFDEEFLACNPRFADTLTTSAKRGCNRWFVAEGPIPPSFDIRNPDGGNIIEVRSDKRLTIVTGTHPSGVPYRVTNPSKPIRIRWDEIQFPANWPKAKGSGQSPRSEDTTEDGGLAKVTEKYGEMLFESQQGAIRLNQQSIAAHFCFENPIQYFRNVGFHEYDSASGVWMFRPDPEVKVAVGDFLGSLCDRVQDASNLLAKRTDRVLTEIANLMVGVAAKDSSQTKISSDLVHVGNGMLDLGGSEPALLPFDPDYLSLARVPHHYEPAASCPTFEEFLRQAVPEDDVLLLQKAAGMLLAQRNFGQAIILLIGAGGAGKGTLVDIMSQMVGRNNCVQMRTNLLTQRFEVGKFIGKILLVGADVPGDFLNKKGAETLKSLSGGDVLDAELKNQNGTVALTGQYNIWITANTNLRVSLDGDRGAWGRRLKIVNFARKADRVIPNYASQIVETEASGILNWMIEGLSLLKRDYAEQHRWVVSDRQQKVIEDLLDESDSICAFAKEEIELGEPVKDSVTSEELYRGYEMFCSDRQWVPQSNMAFSKGISNLLLERFGVHCRHDIYRSGAMKRGYQGVKLVTPVTEPQRLQRDLGESKLKAKAIVQPYEPNTF